MKPAEGASIYFLEDEAVLFYEPGQILFRLNTSAAFIWCLLEEGCDRETIHARLVSTFNLADDIARQYYLQSEETFRELGVIEGFEKTDNSTDKSIESRQAIEYSDDQFILECRYRLLSSRFLIRFSDPDQLSLMEPVIGHLAETTATAPTTTIDIIIDNNGRITLCEDYVPVLACDRLNELAPLVKSIVWKVAVQAHSFFLDIHAGVVGDGKQCILLPAPPGSGKSSLTLALVSQGFEFFSDEVALLHEPDFQVESVPLAACIKDSGIELLSQYYPQLTGTKSHLRGDGKIVHYLPPDRARMPPHGTKRPVAAIIFPNYDPSVEFDLSPMSKTTALINILNECLVVNTALNHEKIQNLLKWIKTTPCFTLTHNNLEKAVESIKNLKFVAKI